MPALRNFFQYGNTAPYAPFTQPCTLADMDGYIAAGGVYLQIHDSINLQAGDIPVVSIQIQNGGPLPSLFQTIGPITFNNGLAFAISSTGGTYTAVGTEYSIWGAVEEFEGIGPFVQGTLTTAGDTSTGVNSLQVWTQAAGLAAPKSLVKVTATNGGATKQYLMLFSVDSPSDGDAPIAEWGIDPSDTITLNFGPNGIVIQSKSSTYVRTYGCSFFGSETPTVLTSVIDNSFNIKAEYK